MSTAHEKSAAEYAQAQAACRENFVYEGLYGSMTAGNALVMGLVLMRYTAFGRRLTWHPYALLTTASYVAPFWIRGESAVIECQRRVFDDRKRNIERQNRDLFGTKQ